MIPEATVDTEEWEADVREQRAAREEYFREHPHSPVPEGFAGLAYYPPDPDYRVVVELEEHDDPEEVVVETTADGEQTYLRAGTFEFEIEGETVTLQAYRPPGEERLWLPFRDATSGSETYGAGRYLDLEPESHLTDEGWIVDFNRAYNPTCAYNEAYECPLIPPENWLDVPVEAGEKAYPGEPIEPHGHGHGGH